MADASSEYENNAKNWFSGPAPLSTDKPVAPPPSPSSAEQGYLDNAKVFSKRPAGLPNVQPITQHGAGYEFSKKYIDPLIQQITGRSPGEQEQENQNIRNRFQEGTADGPLSTQGIYNFENSMLKGVPLAGRAVNQTPAQSEFEDKHPFVSGAGEMLGAAASTAPIFKGVDTSLKFTERASPAILKALEYAGRITGGGVAGGTINTADLAADKGPQASDKEYRGAFEGGALAGMSGPGAEAALQARGALGNMNVPGMDRGVTNAMLRGWLGEQAGSYLGHPIAGLSIGAIAPHILSALSSRMPAPIRESAGPLMQSMLAKWMRNPNPSSDPTQDLSGGAPSP